MTTQFPSLASPFGDPVASVHLPQAPLNVVIAQVRFPAILSLEIDSGRELIAGFQERIRDDYPLVTESHEVGIALTEPDFIPKPTSGVIYRFSSANHGWQVSLTKSFAALQTDKYTERADLTRRLRQVVEALAATVRPTICERIGVRYSSRISDPALLERLPDLIRPEIVGAAADPDLGLAGIERVHSVTDSLYALPGAALRARWGIIPPGTTIDPNVPPASSRSFFIDVDVFSTEMRELEPDDVLAQVEEFCDRQYRYFRWMVTAEYLLAHGGVA